MTTCPRDDSRLGERPPGTWKPLTLSDGQSRATFVCPTCATCGTLEDYTISPDGVVDPSVICPNERCNFHDHITLDGWREFIAQRAARLN